MSGLVIFFSAHEYALGAGDRQFESGHPENISLSQHDLFFTLLLPYPQKTPSVNEV